MGIPRFFYWLYKEYPYVINNIQEKETLLKYKINIDTYALDLNAIVHPICQQIFEYGQYGSNNKYNNSKNIQIKRLLHSKKSEYTSKRVECYNKICEKINELVDIVNPRKKIILALDGTAGMSKQYQQRQRRYRAIIENPITDKKEFDSNEITTGSIFMNELAQCIQEFIQYKIKKDWKELDIYFSSEQVPGEGEHKIMHLLKQYSSFDTYCIHSPDADLIMLSLASLCTHEFKKCYIIRDNIYQHVNSKYFVVDVNNFSDLLINKFKKYSITGVKQHYISDFIFYCLFFGNDFLPENPVMLTDKNGIDMLFLLYSETLIHTGNLTKIHNNKIILNIQECIHFFQLLSKNEELLYKKKYNNEHNNKDNNEEDNNEEDNDNINSLEKFKKDYYKTKLNFDVNNIIKYDKQINKLCNEYMKGMQFVLNYYLYDIPDWYWFYSYHYAPFFSDIYNYLVSIQNKRILENSKNNILSFKFDKNEPLTPYEQLLAVLPPESSSILPKPFTDLMISNNSEISNFYPCINDIKIEIKNQYEKTILVPFINVELLRNTFKNKYTNNKDILTKEELDRNLFKNTISYINSNKYKL
jgi:5'-3' exoribonuclease 2